MNTESEAPVESGEPRPSTHTADSAADLIPSELFPTVPAMFRERLRRSPDAAAYTQYDEETAQWHDVTWNEVATQVGRWQQAMRGEGLKAGDRVAIQMRNRLLWPIFDQAALGLGLIVVPLYTEDRADNLAYVLEHSGARLLLVEGEAQWRAMETSCQRLDELQRVLVAGDLQSAGDVCLTAVDDWLDEGEPPLLQEEGAPDSAATIVYTSGTTGRPKGVVLTHRNLVSNCEAANYAVSMLPDDVLLSFLPLSHTLERTAGYYMPMMSGSRVAFARSVADLPEDLKRVRPTVLIAVPRIFERVYGRINEGLQQAPAWRRGLFRLAVDTGWKAFKYRQGQSDSAPSRLLCSLLDRLVGAKVRKAFGGRLRVAISGGAPLPYAVARTFIGLGLNLLQGYGLTESSPVIAVNTLTANRPRSIGRPVFGVEVRIGENQELLARGPNIMQGYWRNPEATAAAIDAEGWLHTGDQARIEEGFVYITGRIKEIIVLANGEKVPPADLEGAIIGDPLFEQAVVVGEGMPYLSALLVLNESVWKEEAAALGVAIDSEQALDERRVQELLLARVAERLRDFPGYARIFHVRAYRTPWTLEDGLCTPTMKLKRNRIVERFAADIERMYEGHVTLGGQ